MSHYPMQTAWKVKQDTFSQLVGKMLWDASKFQALLLGASEDYNYINKIYDAQIKLFQVNNARRIS